MSNLKDIFGEVETILVENQEKRESIRDAAKELEAKVIASMQVSTPSTVLNPVLSVEYVR